MEKNPEADKSKLYRRFRKENESTLRIYRKQFLENYNKRITINIFGNLPEETKEKCDFDTFEAILTELNVFPAYILTELYWETKDMEENGKTDYSVVKLYNDLFNKVISGKYNFAKISDFIYSRERKIKKMYQDMGTTEKDAKERIWNSMDLCSNILTKVFGNFLYKPNRDYKDFKLVREKKKTYNDLVRFAKVYILADYILIELYTNAPHLLNRREKFIFRDLKQLRLLISKAHRINGKHYDFPKEIDFSFDPIKRFNDKVPNDKKIESDF